MTLHVYIIILVLTIQINFQSSRLGNKVQKILFGIKVTGKVIDLSVVWKIISYGFKIMINVK